MDLVMDANCYVRESIQQRQCQSGYCDQTSVNGLYFNNLHYKQCCAFLIWWLCLDLICLNFICKGDLKLICIQRMPIFKYE